MATDIATLGIKIEADDIRTATKELDRLENQAGKSEKATDGLSKATDGLSKKTIALAASAAALAAAYKIATSAIRVTAEFEKLSASLETVTGSSEAATDAMAMIREMASETPFSVQQLTESFIKLKALGLDPSREALISYGNTASAMGKDLNQMIEAVADAATGEFERLKEFGIKAKSEGDRVSFTFQGITKTVGKNAAEIEGYLRDIGEFQFAGAMEKQMDTLDGAFSNFNDSMDNLLLSIGEAGVAGQTKQAILELSALLSDPKTIGAATALTSALVDGMLFAGKGVTTFILELTDLGDAIGAYGAVMAAVAKFDFEQAERIVDLRKQERAEIDAAIEKIWEEKAATDELNKSKGVDPDRRAAPIQQPQALPEQSTGTEKKTKEQIRLEREAARVRRSLMNETDLLFESFDLYDKLLSKNLITQGEWADAVRMATDELTDMDEEVKNAAQAIEDAKTPMDEFGESMIGWLERGELSWKSLATTAVRHIAKIISASNEVGPVNVGGVFDDIIGGVGKKFGGFFADGGRPSVGQVSVVGENGPELFVPDAAGTVVPNNQLGTQPEQSINLTQVIQVSTGVQETVRAEIVGMMPLIQRTTEEGVVAAMGRGGDMTRAVRGAV